MKKELISRRGYEKLYQQYLDIDKEIAEVQRKMGESARRDNDLRENSEYLDLRVKVMYMLPNKKKELYERFNNAIIIEETEEYNNFDGNTVIIGSEVQLLMDGEENIFKILGNSEGDIHNGIISCEAPLAIALINKHVGEKIQFRGMEISILSVKRI